MHDLQVFSFENQQVRIIQRNGEPWFVAKDVCDLLEIENSRDTLRNFPESERAGVGITDTSSNGVKQARSMNAVNEPGLYRLIFQSRKPEAEKFKTWVFHDVLPTLRKTGTYTLPGREEKTFRNPYPFFTLPDAAPILDNLSTLLLNDKVTRQDFMQIVLARETVFPVKASFNLSENPAPEELAYARTVHRLRQNKQPSTAIVDFVESCLEITGLNSDFILISAVYAFYTELTANPLSRNKFVRQVKKVDPCIIVKQKKLNGFPALVFSGIKPKE